MQNETTAPTNTTIALVATAAGILVALGALTFAGVPWTENVVFEVLRLAWGGVVGIFAAIFDALAYWAGLR